MTTTTLTKRFAVVVAIVAFLGAAVWTKCVQLGNERLQRESDARREVLIERVLLKLQTVSERDARIEAALGELLQWLAREGKLVLPGPH